MTRADPTPTDFTGSTGSTGSSEVTGSSPVTNFTRVQSGEDARSHPRHLPEGSDIPPPLRESAEPMPQGDFAAVDAAAAQLAAHVDVRWVEVADLVLNRALLAPRRSLPVQAQGRFGPVKVSEHVLRTYVRAAIADVPAASPVTIIATVDKQDHCTGLTIGIIVQYGQPVLPIADEIRDRTERVLREVLGPVIPAVTVRDMHVHVQEVTTSDPHTGRALR